MKKILVTGATGYIGGRLVPFLLQSGYQVRVLVRDPERLIGRDWLDQVELVKGDVLVAETLPVALKNISAAYYLIHSMKGGEDFHKRDLLAAENFGKAARAAHVERIIYLGGLGDSEADLSEHLKSRQETGIVIARAGVPVTEFRAAVIVGSGSISFEMIRYLTERIPLMVCPRWVYTRTQPIAISDVLDYLQTALQTEASMGKIIEIGGKDVLTYGDMMLGYAQVRGLKRRMLPVPLLTPKLSAYWVHWMTPVSAEIAHALVQGLRNEAIVKVNTAEEIFPGIKPMDYLSAVKLALEKLDAGEVETRWTDALVSSMGTKSPIQLTTSEGMIIERRQVNITAKPDIVFNAIKALGGDNGWLYLDWAWQLRGLIDRLMGGVGLRRGRRDPNDLRVGDALDFWRVEFVEKDSLIRLRSEMITPGEAWLEFELLSLQTDQISLIQTAIFAPRGLSGLAYWYILYPFHSLVFSGLINGIKKLSENKSIDLLRKGKKSMDK
ncbi:MAG: SDR family oxidoreductase [Anaerolineales bacterium]|nr:MAG: SDR family oxidoreductase [Anaerolineales bacterium]